jgi:hypothetical protein
VFKIKELVEHIIQDPKWSNYMTEYNVSQAVIEEHFMNGQALLNDWALEHGYNLTEIRSNIEIYVNSNATEYFNVKTVFNKNRIVRDQINQLTSMKYDYQSIKTFFEKIDLNSIQVVVQCSINKSQ